METMRQIHEVFGNAVLYVGLAALACISVGSFFYATMKYIGPVLDRIRRASPFEQVFVAVIVGGMCLYGGSKGTVSYDGGIKADTSHANVVTNDLVEVYWVKETPILPNDAPVYIDYREHGSTNEWGLLGQAIVSDYMWEGTLANATNYDYNVWAYYIPPEPVHTNGVWSFSTMRDRKNDGILPMRAVIKADVEILSPPNLKGKIR